MRGLTAVLNTIVCATVAMAVVGAGDTTSLSGGEAEAAYRGWRANRTTQAGRRCGVDLQVDAGQTFVVGLDISGNWSRPWVGSASHGPNLEGYQESRRWAMASVILLAGLSGAIVHASGGLLIPWVAWGVWCLRPNVSLFDVGFIELTLTGSIAGLYLAGLRRYHCVPSVMAWCAVALSSTLGWYLVPAGWLAFFLPATAAWLIVAARHSWPWHSMLLLAVVIGAAPSFSTWHEIYRQSAFVSETLPVEFRRTWNAFGESTNTLASLVSIQLAIAVLPWLVEVVARRGTQILLVTLLGSVAAVGLHPDGMQADWSRLLSAWKLPGTSMPRSEAFWAALATRVDHSARLLIEAGDDAGASDDGFTAVIRQSAPTLVGVRSEGEQSPWTFSAGRLGGRTVHEWTDEELTRFAERWNIGWIVARSPATIARFSRLPFAVRLPIPERVDGVVAFALDRRRSYLLTGTGSIGIDEVGDVVLTDVVPDHSAVVLSLRHYPGWSASPGRITVESEVDPYDPWPLIRLRMPGPFARVVLHPGGS